MLLIPFSYLSIHNYILHYTTDKYNNINMTDDPLHTIMIKVHNMTR